MYAYKDIYLADARSNLGAMFDYAINVHKMRTDDFWDIFAGSKVARALSCGDPKYIAGMSGRELFANLIYDTYQKWIELSDECQMDRTREYWAGFALAYYQWCSGNSYDAIRRCGVMLSDIVNYYFLHESPDQKFVDVMNTRMRHGREDNVLKRLRKNTGMTQKQLSKESGVSLRMIQLYEQGQNDLSKAQAKVVISLSRTLGCDASELVGE